MIEYRGILKIIGVALMTFVFWHSMGIYGLLLGVGVAMVVLP